MGRADSRAVAGRDAVFPAAVLMFDEPTPPHAFVALLIVGAALALLTGTRSMGTL